MTKITGWAVFWKKGVMGAYGIKVGKLDESFVGIEAPYEWKNRRGRWFKDVFYVDFPIFKTKKIAEMHRAGNKEWTVKKITLSTQI